MNLISRGKFIPPIEQATVAREWRARGYSCSVFTDPPGREWNDFVHDCNEVVTVMDGRLKLTIEGETWLLAPGDEAFIPKGAVHSVKNVHTAATF